MSKEAYWTNGTCSRQILFSVDNGIISDVRFMSGCSGNLQAIARLVEGRKIDDVIELLKGIKCQNNTSCPDQLANALIDYRSRQQK